MNHDESEFKRAACIVNKDRTMSACRQACRSLSYDCIAWADKKIRQQETLIKNLQAEADELKKGVPAKKKKIDWSGFNDYVMFVNKYNPCHPAPPRLLFKDMRGNYVNHTDYVPDPTFLHAWRGGKCPVPAGVMVKPRTSDGWQPIDRASNYMWSSSDCITGYVITGIESGYYY